MKYFEKSINCNGARINYIEYNPGNYHHTLVFTHGNSSAANAYESIFPLISNNTRLLSVSFNGHGNSEIPVSNTCSVKEYISTLRSFINALKIESYTIVGHSIGGHVAIEAAPSLDNSLEGLICICSPPFNQKTISEAFTDPSNGCVFKDILNDEEVDILANCFIDPKYLSGTELDKLKFNITNTNVIARPGIGHSIISGDYNDEVSIINDISIPVCFIQGEHDKFINKEYYYKYINNDFCEIHIISDSCHYPHIENPKAVAVVINTYLDNILEKHVA